MWLLLAFLSAVLLGFYDAFKKESLRDNAVLPVLFLNTVFSSLVFVPFILLAYWAPGALQDTPFAMPVAGWEAHKYILLKSFIVLSSWVFGYFGMKHLPLTIVGPTNATRPVMVLLGALLFFGERLNLYQWIGVLLAVLSFFMLSRSGRKEGIDFKHNKWIFFIVLAAVTGAISGLYDKYLMTFLDPMLVQSWYNLYQVCSLHHGTRPAVAMVSTAQDKHSFPLGVDHCRHFAISLCSRLRLLLRFELRRFHDIHRFHGAQGQCGCLFPFRSPVLPRKEPSQQGGRLALGAYRYVLPLFG